jgi:uncharacterized protein YdaU (DUF1376 family)
MSHVALNEIRNRSAVSKLQTMQGNSERFLKLPPVAVILTTRLSLARHFDQGAASEGVRMHYFQFNIGDFYSHTSHLEPVEECAYRRMLDYCYLHEIGLPPTVEEIARLIRMRTHCECIANVLREFFVQHTDGSWHSDRADKEIAAFREKSGKAAGAARKRWENSMRTHSERNANAMHEACEGNANHKPLTINHKPLTNKDNGASAPMRILFADLWDSWPAGYGEKGSRKNAEAAFLKLKPDRSLVDRMKAAVQDQWQAKNTKALSGAFVSNFKHVERWLKGREWESEVEAQPEPAAYLADMNDRSWAN